MVYLWGKANAWCWVSLFPKAKSISPQVRRARPAGTKSFTLALTAKRQQWIMFINQPHSSSGGAAESKRVSGSRMYLLPLSDQKTSGTNGPWLLRHVQALRHVQRAQRQRWLNHTRHLCGAQRAAPARENLLILLEKLAQLLSQPPRAARLGTWGGTSSSASCQHPCGTHLRAAGWEKLMVSGTPLRALMPGHPTPQDRCFHPFSSVTSCPRVGAKLLLWMSLAFFGWDLHQATAGVSGSQRTHPWPGLLPNAFRRQWPDTKSHYFWKQEFFCICK